MNYDTTNRVCDIVKIIKQLLIFGTDTIMFYPNNFGRNVSFGLMAILPVVLGKFHQQLSKSILKAKDSDE